MRDIMKILQQAQEMQGKMAKMQEELQQMILTGTAGGGMVTADVNGQGLGGKWYVVGADGNAIMAKAQASGGKYGY